MKTKSNLAQKILLLLVPLFLMTVTGTQLAMAAGSREFEKPPCYDITGTSQPVLINGSGQIVPASGVNNSGILDFDDNGVAPQYQACVRMSSFDDNAVPVRVEGWVWNQNIGWVSLYCPQPAGKNLDISCGSVQYSINFTTTGTGPDFTSVKLDGEAWNDNIGWITFDTAYTQVKPVSSGMQRGLVSTGSAVTDKFAWNDSLGWFDISGTWFHWEDTDPPVPDPNVLKYVSVCSSKDLITTLPYSPPDSALSYSTGGNGPTAISFHVNSNSLWIVNSLSKTVAKMNAGSGGLLGTFSSVLPNEDSPIDVEADPSNTRVYIVSYNPGTSFGLFSVGTSVGMSKSWASTVAIDKTWSYSDILADATNSSVWLAVNDNIGTGHLLRYNSATGTLMSDLIWPVGEGINQITRNTSSNFIWVLQKDNKLVKVRPGSPVTFYNGSYAASLYNPGISSSVIASSEMVYDGTAIWIGLKSTSKMVKINANTGLLYTGSMATSSFTSPVTNPDKFKYVASTNDLWIVGAQSRTGRMTTAGANLGLYPDVGMTYPVAVTGETNNIWTVDGKSPGFLWRVSSTTVPGFSVGDPRCNCDLDGTCAKITDETKVPSADGTGGDEYYVDISFVDSGSKIPSSMIEECPSDTMDMYTYKPGGKDFCAKFTLVWEDDVDYDQTTRLSQSQATPKYNLDNTGAVRKPLNYALGGPDFQYVNAEQWWRATVNSFAPTSDRNFMDNMQNERFYFYDVNDIDPLDASKYNPDKIDQNLLKLKGIKLLFYKYVPIGTPAGLPGGCLYGLFEKGFCKAYDFMVPTGSTISFNPLVKLDKLSYLSGVGATLKRLNYISLDNTDSPQNMEVSAATKAGVPGNWNSSFKIGLTDNSSYEFRLIDNLSNFADAVLDGTGVTATRDKQNTQLETWVAKIFTLPDIAGTVSSVGPYLYSKISYTLPGASPTIFWGTKLPRIKASLLINPVAKIQGNVYLTDYGKKAKDVTLNSLGNISSNLRRTQIYENVKAYLRGYTGSIATGNKTFNALGGFTAANLAASGLTPLVPNKVYYLKDGNLTIDCGTQCLTYSGINVTFIVENGNIFLNSNIRPSSGNSQVGLIALRNLDGNVQNQGFLFVEKGVTWMRNVQIYVDRLIQSYDKASGTFDAVEGFWLAPNGTDDYARQNLFKNQLVLEGTLASMNGIGNATPDPGKLPTDENGRTVTAGTYCSDYKVLTGICRARTVDLNYLRYYGPGLEICPGNSMPKDQKLKNVAAANYGCDPMYTGYEIDANGLYAAVSSNADNGPDFDMIPGAMGGTPADYFPPASPTMANQFPVNFFYVPISKDLGGFEVQQDFNPLVY